MAALLSAWLARSVHPHARGENPLALLRAPRSSGSPPRTWGKSAPFVPDGVKARFTPTHVGKMPQSNERYIFQPVHPHARGENLHPSVQQTQGRGSPPTHVGKITSQPGYSLRSAVHPHARGENSRFTEMKRSGVGSPPRTWGKYNTTMKQLYYWRFTPTHVGKML